MRILCVEHNQETSTLLQSYLESWGFEAIAVTNTGDALRLISQEQFCLYIIGGVFPNTSGLDLCVQIRLTDKTTPLILFSGDHHEAKPVAQAGVNAYVLKPYLNQLMLAVTQLLNMV